MKCKNKHQKSESLHPCLAQWDKNNQWNEANCKILQFEDFI